MANTIMTAKNTFAEGLIMDFAPDNTQATCMTSALNATLLTFNGNEMSLQNDMGNGRVETAYLPEGYIPVGTCEFGDIIYIVSYNPISNQSQIGCFPSPERNISSEEIYYSGGNGYQRLNYLDFQEINQNGLTGTLKNTSVKKVLIDSKKLNPGDKYIIYSTPDGISKNASRLSDLNNKAEHGSEHKYLKLHIVSIDDSGKITYLDSTTKWYNIGNDNKYYIDSQATKNVNGNMIPDIDSYRNLLQSGWSIFSSKVSGKLAILAELETIDDFSCSYELELIEKDNLPYEIKGTIKYKKYKVYIIPEWTTEGTDLSYIMITKSQFNNTYIENGKENRYKYIATTNIESSDSEGYKKSDIEENGCIYIGEVEIPYQEQINGLWVKINSPSFVYTMDITPAMSFGRLDYLTVTLEIDFNKVGTGEIELTEWKYHNSGTTSILQYGINTYPKPEWVVDNVIIQFFDNVGLVGEYKLEGKKSYSGTHTEYFGLDGEAYNSKFSRKNSLIRDLGNGENIIKHPGSKVTEGISIEEAKKSLDYCVIDNIVYTNDARTLYSGFIYLAKIIVNQRHKLGEDKGKSNKIFYRWFWTNSMFNEYFYQVKDFKELNFELILNGEALFESAPTFQWKYKELNNLANNFEEGDNWKTYSANVQYIGREGSGNINMYINAGLQNNYDCFNLNVEDLSKIDLEIWLSSAEINYLLPDKQYEFSDSETSVTDVAYLSLNKQIIRDGTLSLTDKFNYLDSPQTLAEEKILDNSNNIVDGFNIYFISQDDVKELEEEEAPIKAPYKKVTLDKCYYRNEQDKQAIPLSMKSILFNKAYVQDIYSNSVQVPVYTPIINSTTDLYNLGIHHKEVGSRVQLAFRTGMAISQTSSFFSGIDFYFNSDSLKFETATDDDYEHDFTNNNRIVDVSSDIDFVNTVWGNISSRMGLFFPVYLGGYNSTDRYNALNNSPGSFADVTQWQKKRSWLNNISNDSKIQTSLLAEKAFDIKGSSIREITDENAISFLGMKYKDGITLFNSAFVDSDSGEGKDFLQKDRVVGKYELMDPDKPAFYDNFAYHLYLILSNVYHKDKRIEDADINIKNYVRNGNYSVELLKNVIIKLSQKEEHDILIKGFKFSELLSGFKEGKAEAGSKNITLKLLSYAKNHELKIQVKSQPMSFLETNVDAYIMRNGMLIPSKNLTNNFYIYQNGKLQQFANKQLVFPTSEVTENLQYLLNDNTYQYQLDGARVKISYQKSDFDNAYNFYLNQIQTYIMSMNYAPIKTQSLQESEQMKEQYITNMVYTLQESIYGYSKEYIISYMQRDFFDNVFKIQYGTTSEYWFIVDSGYDFSQHIKQGNMIPEKNYEIDTYFNLNQFKYENGLVLDPAGSFTTFGVRDNAGQPYESGYGGFIRNIVVDLNYQVVKR